MPAVSPAPPQRRSRSPWPIVAVTLAAAFVLVGIALLFAPVREAFGLALRGDVNGLRDAMRDGGVAGALVLYALAIVHIIVPFPSEATNLVAGFVYGIPLALVICSTSWTISAIGTYFIGKLAGRPVAERLAGGERMDRFERLVQRGGWEVLLIARVLPIIPYSLLGFVAGATDVRLRRFIWTTMLGSLPLITLAVILGSRVSEFSLSDPLIWVAIGGFIGLVVLVHPTRMWLERRHRTAPLEPLTEPAAESKQR